MQSRIVALLLVAAACVGGARAQETAPAFDWQAGPTTGAIGDTATIAVPKDYVFLDKAETTRYVEYTKNIPSGEEQLFAPDDGSWDAYFSFSAEGYVKDKDALDADAILATMKEGQAESNAERRRRGWSELEIVGWHIPPRYNTESRVLEWATILKDSASGNQSINYNTRILGRKGVMTVQLVSAPERFDASLTDFRGRLKAFDFRQGDRYADFKPGDHVAEYGLAALVAGGAVAMASKKGLFGAIAAFFAAAWKIVIPLFVAAGVWLKRLFSRKKTPE